MYWAIMQCTWAKVNDTNLHTSQTHTLFVAILGFHRGRVVRCPTCDREVVGSNPSRVCCVPTPTQRASFRGRLTLCLTPTVVIMGTAIIQYPSPERQSARMSKITNDGLTRSGTGCFYICTHMATVGVRGLMSTSEGWGVNGHTFEKYPRTYTRTRRYCSFINHALNNYQDKMTNTQTLGYPHHMFFLLLSPQYLTYHVVIIRYDTIEEINVDSKAEYTA